MKKILSTILVVLLLLSAIPMGAFTFTASAEEIKTSGVTGDCKWSLDGTVLTISGEGKMGDYTANNKDTKAPWGTKITSAIFEVSNSKDSESNCGVTHIGNRAFENCTALTSITIPDSVVSIGWGAFKDCKSLTSIEIGEKVQQISASAFVNTGYYENDDNWKNDVLYIGNYLIKAKSTISGNYTINDKTIAIAYFAFSDCSELTSITIPNSVSNIGAYAFNNCNKLTDAYYSVNIDINSLGNDNLENALHRVSTELTAGEWK